MDDAPYGVSRQKDKFLLRIFKRYIIRGLKMKSPLKTRNQ